MQKNCAKHVAVLSFITILQIMIWQNIRLIKFYKNMKNTRRMIVQKLRDNIIMLLYNYLYFLTGNLKIDYFRILAIIVNF